MADTCYKKKIINHDLQIKAIKATWGKIACADWSLSPPTFGHYLHLLLNYFELIIDKKEASKTRLVYQAGHLH